MKMLKKRKNWVSFLPCWATHAMTFVFPVSAADLMLLLLYKIVKMLLLYLFDWHLYNRCHCHWHYCRSHWLSRYFHKYPPSKLNYLMWLYWLPTRDRAMMPVMVKNNPNRMNLKFSNDYQDKDPAKNKIWTNSV